MQRLILASSSPRRKELLENLHLTFEISSSDVDESFDAEMTPAEVVKMLAKRKAQKVFESNPDAFVIGSDTVVVSDELILGKPETESEAIEMLKRLSGKTHSVFTGVAILSPIKNTEFYEKTDVMFWELTDEEIRSYVQSGEPFDKAGGYGIQGFGSMLVKKISGDYFAVVGLPVSRTLRELQQAGYKYPYS
ncbi:MULTISPECIES: nucleoside triphosphate pyrophosphatase [unclassified Bacillus (in: firmicutes)]|uniref:Maf family protein n=1 Tax=unclassified Bacillus (in: firmicutes) TaxID=185979 RepID=UPI0008EFF78E|nr:MULTISPECIES: Maf family protein [unclassified Bacillus (in: firmicutes)]SFB16223.1 septum formation protein [Bacillus sp. UNCCL13]SFQ78211.1 septum formation protein [Bacillus sp. cl95]